MGLLDKLLKKEAGINRNHENYHKVNTRGRFIWVSCDPLSVMWRSPGLTYIRAIHGEIGGKR